MADKSDIILAAVAVAGLGLLIYAGEQIANWSGSVEKGFSNWWGGVEKAAYNAASLGQTPQQIKASGVGAWSWQSAMPNVNFILWGLPQKEMSAIGNWWSGVEKRLEKGLTTCW